MATIKFNQGNIFEKGIDKYELCLFYGHHGMAFGLGYSLVKDRHEAFRNIESPFDSNPNNAIEYSPNKYLVCVPHDFMTDDELNSNLTEWLGFANKNQIKKIALTGVRDSAKQSLTDKTQARQNDDNRVKYIVEFLKEWLTANSSSIKEVLLIAMSDNYTRNYHEPINID